MTPQRLRYTSPAGPLVFRGATALALLHAVDDAFLNRQSGVPWDQHWLAGLISVAAAAAAIVAFP